MSFFGDLFERIPGGTGLGNTVRNIANEVSNGLLGNGAAMISQVDYDLKNLTDAEYLAKYGKTKAGVVDPSVTPNPNIMAVNQQIKSGVNASSSVKLTLTGFLKKYWWLLILPGGLIIMAIVRWLTNGKGNNSSTYKKRSRGR